MDLADFDEAIGREGYCYELSRGVITVTDVPHPDHLAQVMAVRDPLVMYRIAHPKVIHSVTGSNESKILLADDQSERHPDISVYLTPPPPGKDVWSIWVPAIVVEVVSERSAKRDYQEKPPEYLRFGVTEYLVVDGFKRQVTVLERWRGRWKPRVLKAEQRYTTRLLPGFSLDLKLVFGTK